MKCPNCNLERNSKLKWLTDEVVKTAFRYCYLYKCPRCISKFYFTVMQKPVIWVHGGDPNKLIDYDDFFYTCGEKP
ncbi:MAG: hypothetical protein ACXADW_24790 [Candidatus Hodarchaeales archaeon]|jgi:hypothetical protein